MRKFGFTEEPKSLCCMFLCMSASCMNLFFLTLFFISYYLLLFSLSQQDNYDDVCHVKIKKKFMKYYHIKSINPLKCNQKFDLFFLRSLNFGFNHFPSNRSLVFSILFFDWSVISIHFIDLWYIFFSFRKNKSFRPKPRPPTVS